MSLYKYWSFDRPHLSHRTMVLETNRWWNNRRHLLFSSMLRQHLRRTSVQWRRWILCTGCSMFGTRVLQSDSCPGSFPQSTSSKLFEMSRQQVGSLLKYHICPFLLLLPCWFHMTCYSNRVWRDDSFSFRNSINVVNRSGCSLALSTITINNEVDGLSWLRLNGALHSPYVDNPSNPTLPREDRAKAIARISQMQESWQIEGDIVTINNTTTTTLIAPDRSRKCTSSTVKKVVSREEGRCGIDLMTTHRRRKLKKVPWSMICDF